MAQVFAEFSFGSTAVHDDLSLVSSAETMFKEMNERAPRFHGDPTAPPFAFL
jgi:hypothetical protein